jgi:hypothetical protein
MSLAYMFKRVGLKLSPCFAPKSTWKRSLIIHRSYNNIKYLNTYLLASQNWGLQVNTQKTKNMIMSKSKNRTVIDNYNFYFGPRPLDYMNEYKYLGIIFDNNGNIRIAAENMADETRKAYFVLKSKLPSQHVLFFRYSFLSSTNADFNNLNLVSFLDSMSASH